MQRDTSCDFSAQLLSLHDPFISFSCSRSRSVLSVSSRFVHDLVLLVRQRCERKKKAIYKATPFSYIALSLSLVFTARTNLYGRGSAQQLVVESWKKIKKKRVIKNGQKRERER